MNSESLASVKHCSKKLQSTRSYALARSSLYAQKVLLSPAFELIACRHSKAISALSVMSLPGIKAFWFGEIISSNRGLNLFMMHFDTTL
jgi:hypothetical protein